MRSKTRYEASATDGGRSILFLCPIFFNITEFIASIGNSINGPITNTSDITGCRGNVIVAIASETGEFRADVVNINGIIFLKDNFSIFPVKNENKKIIKKNVNNGGNNLTNTITLSSNNDP
jgi:hypothetical protein